MQSSSVPRGHQSQCMQTAGMLAAGVKVAASTDVVELCCVLLAAVVKTPPHSLATMRLHASHWSPADSPKAERRGSRNWAAAALAGQRPATWQALHTGENEAIGGVNTLVGARCLRQEDGGRASWCGSPGALCIALLSFDRAAHTVSCARPLAPIPDHALTLHLPPPHLDMLAAVAGSSLPRVSQMGLLALATIRALARRGVSTSKGPWP